MKPKIDPAVAEAAKQRTDALKAVVDAEVCSALDFVPAFFAKTIWYDGRTDTFSVRLDFTVPREVAERWAK
jgi:hypothetical protein